MGGDESDFALAGASRVTRVWRDKLLSALTVTALTLATLAFPVMAVRSRAKTSRAPYAQR